MVDHTLVKNKPSKCYRCGSGAIAEILYGFQMPNPKLEKAIKGGEIILREYSDYNNPQWHCQNCGMDFHIRETDQDSHYTSNMPEHMGVFMTFQNSIQMEFSNLIFCVKQDENGLILIITQENNTSLKSTSSITIPQEHMPVIIDMLFSASRYMERTKNSNQFAVGSGRRQEQRKSYTLAKKKERHSNAYEKWDSLQESRLKEMFSNKKTVRKISVEMNRSEAAIQARLQKMGLIKPGSTD